MEQKQKIIESMRILSGVIDELRRLSSDIDSDVKIEFREESHAPGVYTGRIRDINDNLKDVFISLFESEKWL